MGKRKKGISFGAKKTLVSALNRSLVPAEYSYNILKRTFNRIKKAAPLVYDEVEALVKSNIVPIGKKKKLFKKDHLAELGDTITSSLITKIPSIDQRALKKIVSSGSSQTFIDMLTKGLSVSNFSEKEYTVLSKEKKFERVWIANR